MALVVQTDEGDFTANAYCDSAFADSHLLISGSFGTWEATDQDRKDSLLIYASYYADNSNSWDGVPVLDFPGLRFPRKCIVDKDGRSITGVPRILKEAVAELAMFFNDNDPFEDSDLAGIAAVSVDVLQIRFSDASMNTKVRPPAATMTKLALLCGGSGAVGRRTAKLSVS